MLFITFNCSTVSNALSTNKYGGAFINMWARDMNLEQAMNFARPYLEAQGWSIQGVEESCDITRDDYADKHSTEGLASFEEAERNGTCFMIHTFPKEELNGSAA
jgi:hypothetical protein